MTEKREDLTTVAYEFEIFNPETSEWGWATNKIPPRKLNEQIRNTSELVRRTDVKKLIETKFSEKLKEKGMAESDPLPMNELKEELLDEVNPQR